ncbi:MAG: hypothetical protein COB04_12410 [Gammaproteobacteria bacterium]|nr:MAG: hypothetical protein COB04_12410 [Gammaproteobacteria bacterium]
MNKVSEYSHLIVSQLGRLSRYNSQWLTKRLRQTDTSLQEFRIAGLLVGEAGINQKELAEKLSVKPATLSVAIAKLEKKGSIRRRASVQDKRVNYLELVESVDFKKNAQLVFELESKLTQGIAADDLRVAKIVFQKMIDNLDNESV